MRFLGTLIHDTGEAAPTRLDILPLLHRICSVFLGVGLALYQVALLWAIQVKAVPAHLYGCEFWSLRELAGVLLCSWSPFCSPHFSQLLVFLSNTLAYLQMHSTQLSTDCISCAPLLSLCCIVFLLC